MKTIITAIAITVAALGAAAYIGTYTGSPGMAALTFIGCIIFGTFAVQEAPGSEP